MKKSGLADSPFFFVAPQKNQAATPLSALESVQPKSGVFTNSPPESPTPEKRDGALTEAQTQQNQDQKRSNDRTFERTDERSNERLNERPPRPKREKIRHTFDIYRDQLIALQMIQLERVQAGKKKPKLGKMVSVGIDLFIKQAASKKKRA